MPYEFLAKNGLISQGNVTVTGSLITSQNVTASNISASGTIIATSFTGSFSGSIGTAINATSASYALSASYAPTNTNITASWATNSLTASYLTPANIYTVAGLSSGYVEVTGTSTIPNTGIYRPAGKTLGLSADGTLILKIDGNVSPYVTSIETGNFIVLSGSVGIGVVSPVNKLDINGNISASVITASFFGTSSWATNAVTASFVSNAFVQGGNSFGTTALLGTNDANSLAFETNGSTRMTINSGGFIGVNTSPTLDRRFNISDTHNGSLGSSSLYIATGQNQNQGLANSANDSSITNVYTVNNFTSSAAIQNQASFNQMIIAGSGSFSGSYRAERNGILFSNTASLDSSGNIVNTYLTNQISSNIPTFSIPNWIAGTQTYVDLITGNSTGSITNLYNHQISSPFPSGGSGGITVTNSYGIYIAKQKTTNIVTNGWGIYQIDTGDLNIFAGKTRIGSTTVPVNTLDVTGNISASVVTASLFFGTASLANTASSLIPTNSYTITNLTASGVVRAAKIAEKVVTFTPLTGSLTGAPAWYRIISGSGVADYGRVRLSTTFDNSRSDLEFTYGVRNYDTDGAGAFINITRASTYNSVFNAVRVIEGTLTTPYAIDVLIGNYLNNTTPDTVTCLYESQFIGAVLDTPTFVSASATGSNSNVVKTVYTTYASGYPRIGPTYSDGLSVATYQGQLTVGYRGNYNYGSPSTNNYALLVSGSVGIGTTSPGEKLTVSGSSYIIGGTGAVGTGTAYYLGDSSNKDISLTRVGAASLAIGRYFPSAWVETIRFTADGNVGIGTTSPSTPLHVFSTTSTLATFTRDLATDASFTIGADNNGVVLGTLGVHAIQFYTNATEKVRITSDGNVGIGIASPTVRLHVSGSSIITNPNPSANSAVLLVQDEGTATTVKDGTTLRVVNNGSAADFSVFEASSAASNFVILNNGNVGIGTTSPASKLHISQTGTVGQFDNIALFRGGPDSNDSGAEVFIGQSGNSRGLMIRAGRGTSDQVLAHFYLNKSGGTIPSTTDHIMTFLQGGSVGIGTTAPGALLEISSSTASSLLNVKGAGGNGILFVSGSGNVGIGTTNTSDKLSVVSGSTRIASSALAGALYLGNDGNNIYLQRDNSYDLSLVQNGDSNSSLYLASAGNVYINIDSNNNDTDKAFIVQNNALKAGTELFRVSETGNVGIGSSNPSSKLEVLTSAVSLANQPNIIGNFRGDTDGRSLIRVDNTSTSAGAAALQAGISFVAYSNVSSQPSANKHEAQIILGSTGATSVTGGQTGTLQIVAPQDIAFNVSASNTIMTGSNYTAFGYNAMYIARSGNVGIGTTNPIAITDIQGTNVTLYAANYVGSVGTIYLRGNDAYNSGTAGAGIYLRGKYDSSSNVTTFGAISAIKENNIDGNYAGALTFLSRTNGQGSGAAEKMRIDSNGNVGIGTSSPAAKLEITGSSSDVLFNIKSPINGNIIYVTGSGRVGINKSIPTATFDVSGSTIITGSLNVSANITCLSLTETSTEAVKYNIIPLTSQLDNVLKLKPVSFNYKTNDKHSIGLIAEEVAKIYPEFTSENNDSISYGKITSVLIQSIKELKNIIDNQQKQIEDLSNKLKQF